MHQLHFQFSSHCTKNPAPRGNESGEVLGSALATAFQIALDAQATLAVTMLILHLMLQIPESYPPLENCEVLLNRNK